MRSIFVLITVCIATGLMTFSAYAAVTLDLVTVSAPDINCIFDTDCTIIVTDTSDHFTLDGTTGGAFLQSRTFPPGEPGTVAEGLYGYEYRLDLRELAGILDIPCVNSFSIEVGPITPLDYDRDGNPDDVYVITSGGLGTVAPSTVEQSDNKLTFTFAPPVCAGGAPGNGQSSFFFGLASAYPPREVVAQIQDTVDTSYSLDARAPAYSITVWHAWQGPEKILLEQLAAGYQAAGIQLTGFDTDEALLDALRAAAANKDGPTLFLGPDTWADELMDLGLVNAYCLPGQCPQCEGPNPPPWCRYATGDFSYSLNNDFAIAGLCDPENCPACFGPNPPRWCWAATANVAVDLDIFQAGFARPFPDGVFPIGIPIWWEYTAVLANPAWFVERELPLPASLGEIVQLAGTYPELVYIDPELAGDPSPDPMRWFFEALPGDPDPQPSVSGILVIPASRFRQLQNEIGPLFLFPLSDYLPEPMVQGIYLNANTDLKSQALDFAYLAADEETQIDLFEITRRLPTNGEAWVETADAAIVEFGQQSMLAFLDDLPDPPRPPFPRPEFGDDVCGKVAAEYYQRLTASPTTTDFDRVRALFASLQFARFCRRYMPDFGNDFCARQAEYVFARNFADNRGTPGAVTISSAFAKTTLVICRSGVHVLIDPATGGVISDRIAGLEITLMILPNVISEPLGVVIQEGPDVPGVTGSATLGDIFAINAYNPDNNNLVTQFDRPLNLSARYDDADLGEIDEASLSFFFWDTMARRWVEVPSTVDTTANLITAELDHLTTYAVRESEGQRIYLPTILK